MAIPINPDEQNNSRASLKNLLPSNIISFPMVPGPGGQMPDYSGMMGLNGVPGMPGVPGMVGMPGMPGPMGMGPGSIVPMPN